MKTIILMTSIGIASGLLFTNLYTSLVDVKSWESNIPHSIAAGREYFKASNPGVFFRLFSPISQLLALLALLLFWKAAPGARLYLGAALLLYVAGDVFTFAYFYPRNDIMWKTASLTDVNLLTKTVADWKLMNWFRSLIIFGGLCFSFLSLHKIYSL